MKNKTILITGFSRGLGLALSKRWHANNTVIGIARNPCPELSNQVNFFPCDLANEAELVSTIQEITKKYPKIDLLVNNAAILTSLPVSVMKNEDISRMIDVNLRAPILISKIIFRKMMQARSGQIINILSMATKLSVVGDSVYAATKGGLESFSKILNKEGHPFGVHVNNIGLSAYPSGMLDKVVAQNPEKILNLIPHGQYAPFEEIVSAIEFFCANQKDIGGQTLYFGGV